MSGPLFAEGFLLSNIVMRLVEGGLTPIGEPSLSDSPLSDHLSPRPPRLEETCLHHRGQPVLAFPYLTHFPCPW